MDVVGSTRRLEIRGEFSSARVLNHTVNWPSYFIDVQPAAVGARRERVEEKSEKSFVRRGSDVSGIAAISSRGNAARVNASECGRDPLKY